MDKFRAMAYFVQIVEHGSLSAAAEAGGQSVASLVRSLAALERQLGVRLLNRSTRRMALTDEGQRYLAFSKRMLAECDAMERELEGRDGQVRGTLRITAPVEFGQLYLAPLVNSFLIEHPQARAELILNDQIVPLLDERLDLALRIGQLPDSGLMARPLGASRLITCASPAYLNEQPPLRAPGELARHACIAFAGHGSQWYYRQGGKSLAVSVEPRLWCNQIRAVRLACVQGLGVARLLHYQAAEALASGTLVRVLEPFEPPDLPVQLVYPHGLALAPRVKAFVEWAAPRLKAALPSPA
ncbi:MULTISPECIES: LysR family transcriptional regulator [unclassified Pseudomonas]|uniref:LysR family transcriptional regulator n=1 Tax=unclassified Pseudomonas TaxID=196821 RepID=UPI000BC8C20E|nr:MULTISPECIES: LysR family transcriptional regulator [unclassified Pseudomonas]PVZ20386.1 DNA-binding transcriptional LysR family regulator [Pseudomonas sp. URIL14HWK12:I12]PVZ27452.1 DNA-binding transcriptional LysR family regulator [Pseudomonas sp. URIL14HWK12:I10]PVZ38341.1 DNA-binding transcriptional LysR family regulator [Pseudomonas sp. URIL14HWK12:I11]SNZ03744.1 DNA-binding transcriptional regulator, LysR family [Pseudomonas sp. URIL14HWK12:I9]